MTGVWLSFELSSHLKWYDDTVSLKNNSILKCKLFFERKVVLNFRWEMELTFWPALFNDTSEGLENNIFLSKVLDLAEGFHLSLEDTVACLLALLLSLLATLFLRLP